ncbi:hypothetical protein F5X97DRAFT_303982 [Nemania serpens]|nr:hypothetical protein F5X97DRAFT_303982 [Nemania serpens]
MADEPLCDRDSLLGHEMDNLDSAPEPQPLVAEAEASASFQRPSVWQWWRWELIMLIVSLIAFVALVIVLAVEDGKPAHSWDPLTLNSLNSLLTTVVVVSLGAIVGFALSHHALETLLSLCKRSVHRETAHIP